MADEQNMNIPEQPRSGFRAAGIFLFELIKVIVLAGITIAIIRFYLFKPFYVKGASMEPNFLDHEYLIVDELSYHMRAPQRGEVVVFKYPNNHDEYFLKRIIGLPGERVKISGGVVTVYNSEHPEGVRVEESYLPKDLVTGGEIPGVTLSADEYYVLGDNRQNSFDSRRFGPVKRDLIIGRAFIRGWPLSRISKFGTPSFNSLSN